MTFTTPEAALAACEAAGLEPLTGFDYPNGTRYSVFFPGASGYSTFFSDAQFLGWANAYFTSAKADK